MSNELTGTIIGCGSAILYEEPNLNSVELAFLPVGSEVLIVDPDSIDGFYYVFMSCGIGGFCLRDTIEITKRGGG